MDSFFGARLKELGEKLTSLARRYGLRFSLSTNTEQEDVGDLEMGGGEVEVNNSTMLGKQNVVQLPDLGDPKGGNQNAIQGNPPAGRKVEVPIDVEESSAVITADVEKLLEYKFVTIALNLPISIYLNSNFVGSQATNNRNLFQIFSGLLCVFFVIIVVCTQLKVLARGKRACLFWFLVDSLLAALQIFLAVAIFHSKAYEDLT